MKYKIVTTTLFGTIFSLLISCAPTSAKQGPLSIKIIDNTDVIFTYEIESGDILSRPEDPTKEGYNFINFYSDQELSNLYVFNNRVYKDTSIYTKWSLIQFTVTFIDSDGISVLGTKSVGYNQCLELPEIKKDGYVLIGWFYDYDYKNKFDNSIKITANLNLFAKWEVSFGPIIG